MTEQKKSVPLLKLSILSEPKKTKKEHRLETSADYLFHSSPTVILVVILPLNEEIRP